MGGVRNPTLADCDDAWGDKWAQALCRVEANLERAQVTVVDADNACAGFGGLLKVRGIMDLHERVEAEARGEFPECTQFIRFENGGDQQDCSRPGKSGLIQLVWLNNE